MNIALIFSVILISFGAAAIYLGVSATRKQFREYIGNLLLGILCYSSALWSYGFGLLFLTENTELAYWGRTIGMIGVFGYMIIVQLLVGALVKMPRTRYYFFSGFAFFGVLIYFPTVARNSTIYYVGDWGMTYTFKPGLANNLYTAYALIYAINMCLSIYYMIKHGQDKRSKVSGYRMMVALIIVFVGMVMDTIMPMFGFGAIPGSSITQFAGLLVVYYAIVDHNRTRITDRNMSQYVYSSFAEPVIVLDTEGILRLTNKSAEDALKLVFGATNRSLHISRILEIDDDFLNFNDDHRLDDSHTIVGNTPVQIQTNKIRDKYGDLIGYILTIKDMTDITKAMDSLKEAKALAESNSIAKSAFLANMSHEIRTPLNAILGFSELLLKGDLSDADREQVEDIRGSSHNLLAIINDVLDISKIESNKMELNEDEYEIGKVINDAYLITDTIARKKGLEFKMDVDETIPSKLYGDRVRIRGILVNILNNAVKYTRQGTVSLKCAVDSIEENVATLKFYIKDTGIGIKEEDLPKLFETFLRVDSRKNANIEGTGLGLAIVKGFLDLMHGNISVESVYGEGSTFIITVPQKIIDKTPIGKLTSGDNKPKAQSSIGDVKFKGVKVLAVDDNNVNLKVVSRALNKYEMDVTTVSGGEDAIEKCKNENFDIILMDQMMPVMDGIEAMNHIRELSDYYKKGGKCKIIALTANAISGVREELLECGFDDYLSKPINFASMEEMFSMYYENK